MLSPDIEDELVNSHDELRKVCQACFAILIENQLLDKLDAYLFADGVEAGFAERADEVRRKAMRERVIGLVN